MAAIRIPRLCHHKHSQKGYITWQGKVLYFKGTWPRGEQLPPADVRMLYEDAIAQIQAGRHPLEPISPEPSLDELWRHYLEYCQGYYVKNGKQTSEVSSIKMACSVAARLFGTAKAKDFTPKKLIRVRAEMVAKNWNREQVNKNISRVRRMFRWGVMEEMVPVEVWHSLQSVFDLRKGSMEREGAPVEPVSDEVFMATAKALPGTLQALALVHRLIGCRADEACALRPCELVYVPAKEVWKFTPASSKNDAYYWVGPRAMEILTGLVAEKQPEEYLFQTRKRGAGHWTTASYRRAVERTCRKLGLPVWSPLMVRHAAAQEARDGHTLGIEAAQARLRHKEARTSQIYAAKIDELGIAVAKQMG